MNEEHKIYEGTVDSVKTTDKNGNALIVKNGQSAGNPFVIIGFNRPEGGWLNVTSFDSAHHPILQKGNLVKIAYSEKLRIDDFGDPILYNGNKQWNRTILAAELMGGAAPATQEPSPATSAPSRGNIPAEVSVRQTAANCAIQKAETIEQFNDWFEHVLAKVMDTKPKEEFDAFMDKAKETLDAKEDKADAGDDEDIPFLKG